MTENHIEQMTRRRFLAATALAVTGASLLGRGMSFAQTEAESTPAPPGSFAFPLLGDLHFDRLEHHDMAWMEREYAKDIRQVQNYSRLTAEVLPQLLSSVRATMAERGVALPVPFAMHIGDFVEGVCGSYELDARQKRESIAFLREQGMETPFLFCKGNHDVTGPGAKEAFSEIFLPFLSEQAGRVAPQEKPLAFQKAYFSVRYGDALFAFFDAYDRDASLDWLEATLAQNTARHVFVLNHMPVVPYGARATWHLFSRAREASQRARLLELLGKHRAIVLTGHLHKYNLMTRRTDGGRFLQLSVNSIVSRPDEQVKDLLDGVAEYTPDQIKVEPRFSPDTEAERRAVLAAEAPFVEHFEYASAPGYAVIEVRGEQVLMHYYRGATGELWRTRNLTSILNGQNVGQKA